MPGLAAILTAAAHGAPPPPDGGVTVLDHPGRNSAGVFAFTGHHVVAAPVGGAWVRSVLPADDLSAPLSPGFLAELCARTGSRCDSLDAVLVASGTGVSTVDIIPVAGLAHARVERAHGQRSGVRVWTVDGGVLVLGRGVAGRWEAAVEVDSAVRGRGLGRALFAAALGEVPPGEPVWAQIAPGNAASLRAVLAAGFRPVGAEVLLHRR